MGGYEAGVPHQRRGEGPAARDRGHRSVTSVVINIFKIVQIFSSAAALLRGHRGRVVPTGGWAGGQHTRTLYHDCTN